MVIVNQDRDGYVVFDYSQALIAWPIMFNGVIVGVGVLIDSHLLGTFRNFREALQEIHRILNHRQPVYQITRPR